MASDDTGSTNQKPRPGDIVCSVCGIVGHSETDEEAIRMLVEHYGDTCHGDLEPIIELVTEQGEAMASKQNEAMATGHLVAAAAQAERLTVLLTSMQQIVRARVNPVGLIGTQMAETIEELAVEIVSGIREAVKAAAEQTDE